MICNPVKSMLSTDKYSLYVLVDKSVDIIPGPNAIARNPSRRNKPGNAPSQAHRPGSRRWCAANASAKRPCHDAKIARRPVSRVLSAFLRTLDGHSSGTRIAARLARPTRAAVRECTWSLLSQDLRPLFGLAPGGVYPAAAVTGSAVRSCRPVSPLPSAHGCPCASGGLFSVALSLGSPPPAVSRHRIPVEPGLSSTTLLCRKAAAAVQPSDVPCLRRAARRVKTPMRECCGPG